MAQWASVVGLAMTAGGVLLGFYMPRIAAVWGGPKVEQAERILRIRFSVGFLMVIAGTALQIYSAWPH